MSQDLPSAGDHNLSVKINREGCLHGCKERLLGICMRIADVLADGQMDSLYGALIDHGAAKRSSFHTLMQQYVLVIVDFDSGCKPHWRGSLCTIFPYLFLSV
jgi:hypothetical protein